MKRIPRGFSVITGKKNLQLLTRLPNFPVFIGTTEQAQSKDLFADMDWYLCPQSGVIQLDSLLPEDIVYAYYHSEAVGGIWLKHHNEFVAFCSKYNLKNVLEIGGSNGYIAKKFIEENGSIGWTIIEPTPQFKGDSNIEVQKGFFDKSFLTQGYQSIVHSHVIEHTVDPREYLFDISNYLEEGQRHIFSVPNLYAYLQKQFSNTINFEHSFLLTETLLDYLLSISHFEILEKYYFDDHSIFYATQKNTNTAVLLLNNYGNEYSDLYLKLLEHYQLEATNLNTLIENFDGQVYLFGAHIFSQFLFYQGLNEKKICGILDNSKRKRGQRLYGTGQKVYAPEQITLSEKTAVILKAGQYQAEIKQQLLGLSANVIIWE